MEEKVVIAKALGIDSELDLKAHPRRSTRRFAERIRPMVCDTAVLLNDAIRDGKTVLFEGAQGTMLDIDHGTYPFVTSSSASAGGACTGTGVAPTRIHGVIGVSKAYITRVGGGPFPPKRSTHSGELIRARGKEFGAVTGRPRRCGWFDVPLLRYTATINGFDSLVVTKLDVLDEFDQIPVCVGYRIGGQGGLRHAADGGRDREDRARIRVRAGMEHGHVRRRELSTSCRRRRKEYIAFLEARTGVEVGCISTGPERNQTIVRPGSRFEKLIG